MNRTTLTLSLAAILCTAAVHAQNSPPSSSTVAQPSSPAPAVVAPTNSSNVATAPAPAVVQVPNAYTAAPAVSSPTQIVYTPQLPSADDLTRAATAQGYTVERIIQTGVQVIAFYRNASGQETTVAYQTLPPGAVAQNANPAPVVVTSQPQTVVYETAPRVVYYDDYPRYYYPPVWYPPISLSFGFGYHSFHGGYRGGFHHWR